MLPETYVVAYVETNGIVPFTAALIKLAEKFDMPLLEDRINLVNRLIVDGWIECRVRITTAGAVLISPGTWGEWES